MWRCEWSQMLVSAADSRNDILLTLAGDGDSRRQCDNCTRTYGYGDAKEVLNSRNVMSKRRRAPGATLGCFACNISSSTISKRKHSLYQVIARFTIFPMQEKNLCDSGNSKDIALVIPRFYGRPATFLNFSQNIFSFCFFAEWRSDYMRCYCVHIRDAALYV